MTDNANDNDSNTTGHVPDMDPKIDLGTHADEVKAEEKSVIGSFRRIFSYTDRSGWILNGIAAIAAIGAGTILPFMDLIFGKFVTTFNAFAKGQSTPAEFRADLTHWTLWFVYLFVAKFTLSYIWLFTISLSAIRTTKALRVNFLESTLRQNIGFFDLHGLGSMSMLVTTNGDLVNDGISEKLGLLLQGISTFVTAFIVAFAIQWKLTLITLGIVPSILVVTVISVSIDAKHEANIMSHYSKAGAIAEDVFASMKTVHSFSAVPHFAKMFDVHLKDGQAEGMKKSLNLCVLFSIQYFCVYSGYGLAFWQGIRRYANGEIKESGDVVTVIFAVIVAATALTQFAPQFLNISRAASAASEMFKIIDRKSTIDPFMDTGRTLQSINGTIEIRDVHFSYPSRPDVRVLKGMSLQIPANKTTALVGASGCGKNGVNIQDLNIRWLRENEPVLFHGTVYENVLYGLRGTGCESLSDEERMSRVEEACKAAYAHDFISALPQGYQTVLSERASSLSGGQKQRIAIARSIISQPKILLLDEATSGLDPVAERIVQDALDHISADRTTIVIAHRLSTIRNAHNICVVADGNVIEQGTHDQLMTLGGAYYRLVKAQDLGTAAQQGPPDEIPDLEMTKLQSAPTNKSGRVARIEATPEPAKSAHDYNFFKCVYLLLKDQRRIWPELALVLVACVIGGLFFPVQAILFGKVMNTFQLPLSEMTNKGDFWSLMFFLLAVGNLVVYSLLGWFTNVVSQITTYDFRARMFRDIAHQDMEFFDRPENTTGALVSQLSSFPTAIHMLLGFSLGSIVLTLVSLVSSCILAIIVGWKLGLVTVFSAMPVLMVSGYLRVRIESDLNEANSRLFAEGAALAAEAVSAIRTVTSLTLERHVIETFTQRLDGVERRSLKAFLWSMFWYALTQSISLLAMALGFWYGGTLMSHGEYSTTQFFIVFVAVIFSSEEGSLFFSYTSSITKAHSAANQMLWLRSLVPRINESNPSNDDEDDDEKESNAAAHLECKEIHFAYPLQPHNPVIRNLSVQ
ncbi:P-loop containing protein, partial [Fusarium bulbicola]